MRISDWSSDVCSSDLYGGSAIVALRVVGDRLWRRSGGPSQSHSLKHQQHCHCAEGASQERSSHHTRLRTSSANIAFGQDSNNVSALCRLYRPPLTPTHRLSRTCFGFEQKAQ